jgi:hypothetical protein
MGTRSKEEEEEEEEVLSTEYEPKLRSERMQITFRIAKKQAQKQKTACKTHHNGALQAESRTDWR